MSDDIQDQGRDRGQDQEKRLYGRRKGRPLRKHKTALIETLLPKLTITPEQVAANPAAVFADPVKDVWLEVGFGSGHHLVRQAEAHPDVGLIGCEPFLNGIAGLLALIDESGVTNVRIQPDDARPVIDALPDASIGRAFVLFADPWPKKRHWDRRFIGPENLPRLSRVLKDGAELRLASDDLSLVRWMLEHTVKHPDFEWTAEGPSDWRTRPADWPATRYEEKAIIAGRKPVFMRFIRRPRG